MTYNATFLFCFAFLSTNLELNCKISGANKEVLFGFMVLSLALCVNAETGATCKSKKTGSPCKVEDIAGTCVFAVCVTALSPRMEIRIIVKYPERNSYNTVNTSRMWVRGSGLGLSWNQSKEMKKASEDTWEHSLVFQMHSNLYKCTQPQAGNVCGKKLEFRIRTGRDKLDMLGASFTIPLPLSQSSFFHGQTTSTVYPWFFLNEGEIKEESLFSSELNETRDVQIFLPPSFKENVHKKYDIVFVNDGDVVRVIAAVAKLGEKMATEGTLKELILIGLKNTGTDGDRTHLLSPTNGTQMVCKNGTFKDGCGGCNFCYKCSNTEKMARIINKCTKWVPTVSRGEAYLDFIQYTLLSYMRLRYRALSQQQNVGIMGYSLGGLISCHAAWTRPAVFGSAACMSPSLWWPLPLNSKFPDDVKAEFINNTLKHFRENRPIQKLYLDVGTREDPPGPSLMLEPVRLAAKEIDNTPFFEINKNLWLQVLDKEFHNVQAFISRVWIPLHTLYAPEGSAKKSETVNTGDVCSKSKAATNKNAFHCLLLPLLYLMVTTH